MKRFVSMFAVGLALWASGAVAQTAGEGRPAAAGRARGSSRIEALPKQLEGIGVEEWMNVRLPLEATFFDESGKAVSLSQYFTRGTPVILQLGYFKCPKLCDLVSRSTVEALREVPQQLGKDYSILFVSIDPTEKPELAREKKQSYVQAYGADPKRSVPLANAGWHFLTGNDIQIRELAKTIGFKYRWDEAGQQYAHAAVLIMVTPDGTVSRYLYGAAFDPKILSMSISDASRGKTGSVMEQIILFCFHLDPNTGTYTLKALRIMQVGGAVSVLALGAAVGMFALRGRRLRGLAGPRRGLGAVLHGAEAAPADAGVSSGQRIAPREGSQPR